MQYEKKLCGVISRDDLDDRSLLELLFRLQSNLVNEAQDALRSGSHGHGDRNDCGE